MLILKVSGGHRYQLDFFLNRYGSLIACWIFDSAERESRGKPAQDLTRTL